jgi:hypothetical protein
MAVAVAGLGTLLLQAPAGIAVDRVRSRRLLLASASLVVGGTTAFLPAVAAGPAAATLVLLSLAKIAFHRELLTLSARAGSRAGLHVSTSLGDRRRTLLGVSVAGRPHDREPRLRQMR